ncbi:MAG: VWA domain-containing protein [Hyphomicrobiales bacterium]|nr:VWA domain-containing protein [Hyphomicrobiales bacterium]MCP5371600.1 VWA domain-containing protein [Hyphomicrobiales bacterium]
MKTWIELGHGLAARWTAAPRRWLRRLHADNRGAVLVFVAFSIIPLIGFVGIGTDVARAYMVKSRLSSALDAAGLAGGRNFYSEHRDADINMFFDTNFPTGFLNAAVTGPTITVDDSKETIYLTAEADVPTTFMALFGFDYITVSSATEVTRQMIALDVVLAIDMSGSMTWSDGSGGGSRIEAARSAATELVNILFGDNIEKQYLNIGVVPWSAKVNVTYAGTYFNSGSTTSQAVPNFINPETGASQSVVYFANNSPVPMLTAPPYGWKGCVFNRFLDDGNNNNDADVLMGPITTGNADWVGWQPIFPGTNYQWGGEPVSGYQDCRLSVNGGECERCISHGITALTNQKATILSAISGLTNPTGTTNITQGLGWGWRVVKPAAPFTEAVANPEYKRQQAIVLLTDGENVAGNGDGYKATFGLNNAAADKMDARLRTLAANIKADGVIIYVIQFANDGTDLQILLKEIASGPDTPYYYYAPDGNTLQDVFKEVANHLSELRLSK